MTGDNHDVTRRLKSGGGRFSYNVLLSLKIG